jgi:endonuclease YncB( thermonuclease family)
MSSKPGLAAASLSVMLLAAFLGAGSVFVTARHASAQSASGGSGTVLLNEVELNPRGRDAGGEWVEIYNPTSSAVDISNYKVRTAFRPVTITVPAGTVVGAGQFYVLAVEGDKFADANSLSLLDASGQIVSRTPSLLDKADDSQTWQRIPDGGREWKFAEATRGTANDPASLQGGNNNNNSNGASSNNNSNNNSSGGGGSNSQNATSTSPSLPPSSSKAQQQSSGPQCMGSAMCIEGVVRRIADADTLYVQAAGGGETYKVRLSLVKAVKSQAAESFTRAACLGSSVLVDQDDSLPASRGRSNIVGVAYCASSNNLNQQLLDSGYASLDTRQCSASEFAGQEWAQRHGCRQ